MEEFKNLKEIIELCKEEIDKNDENVNATLDLEDLKELQNLINKYKELEKSNKYWGNKIAEYHKVIELMAEHISKTDIDEAVCKKMIPKSKFCKEYEKSECEKCVIDYFRKKAKGE